MAYAGKIPFYSIKGYGKELNGSLCHYAHPGSPEVEWRTNYEWRGELKFERFERRRSAAYAVFSDKDSHEYPMFLTYLERVLGGRTLTSGVVVGNWTFYKRGTNFSVGLADE